MMEETKRDNDNLRRKWKAQDEVISQLNDQEKILRTTLGEQYKWQIEQKKHETGKIAQLERKQDEETLTINQERMDLDQKLREEKKRYIQETTNQDYEQKLEQIKKQRMAEEADVRSTRDLMAKQQEIEMKREGEFGENLKKRTQKIDGHMRRYMDKVYEKEQQKRSQSLQRERQAEQVYRKKVEDAYHQREGDRLAQKDQTYSYVKDQQVKNTLR